VLLVSIGGGRDPILGTSVEGVEVAGMSYVGSCILVGASLKIAGGGGGGATTGGATTGATTGAITGGVGCTAGALG